MITTARKLLALFTAQERRRLAALLGAIIATGLLQVAGVGSVMPFIALLANPAAIEQSAVLGWVHGALGAPPERTFLMWVGAGVLVLLVGGNALIAVTQWLIARFAWGMQCRLSTRLLERYLAQPYEAFIARNSADFSKAILSETETFTTGVMISALHMLAAGVTGLLIAAFLLWLDPLLALLVGASFGAAYLAVYLWLRRRLLRFGAQRMAANTARFQAVAEAFGSFKELKVLGREQAFRDRYVPAAQRLAGASAAQQALSHLPRYAIEALGFGVVMGLFLYLLHSGQSLRGVLPIAGAFTLAGYRLLPALQQVYHGMSALRFYGPVLDGLHRDLTTGAAPLPDAPSPPPLPFENQIHLREVTYTYPGAPAAALRGVSLAIPRGAYVAFVGATGAGKTTLADVILGLLAPQAGTLSVDGVPVTDANRRAWQANLGYVPQDIYLTDDTIAANIAWGVPPDQVDPAAVERAARIANIHDFITGQLPRGYDTVVGERGVRLSGGQRQRIGIARALYRDPRVLVLDEATSALDNETERRIVEELDALRGNRTLIVIAHRMSTVRRCHNLYLLEAGRILASGSYDELCGSSADFRRLTQAQATVG